MPTWWMQDPDEPGKMRQGSMCNGRLMRVNRQRQIEAVWADQIVSANEVEII